MELSGRALPMIEQARARAPAMSESALDYGQLGDLAGFAIKLAWIVGYSLLQKTIAEPAITPLRYSLLELIASNPGAQQTQLANALGLSRPATSLAIDFWQERGCVERRTDPQDRRSFGIFLTSHGTDEWRRIRALVRDADDALTADLNPDEVRQLRGLLAKIHR